MSSVCAYTLGVSVIVEGQLTMLVENSGASCVLRGELTNIDSVSLERLETMLLKNSRPAGKAWHQNESPGCIPEQGAIDRWARAAWVQSSGFLQIRGRSWCLWLVGVSLLGSCLSRSLARSCCRAQEGQRQTLIRSVRMKHGVHVEQEGISWGHEKVLGMPGRVFPGLTRMLSAELTVQFVDVCLLFASSVCSHL